MKTNYFEVYAGRNKTKRQHQVYIHEAEYSAASAEAFKIMSKNSGSLFFWAAGCVALGMLGHKFGYMGEKDRSCILLLRKEIDKRIS
jgi:hypothetical protein